MLVLLLILSQCLGGTATGGFYPKDCSPSACSAFVTWTPDLEDGTVLFHLEATTMGWVAVGLSADQKMGTDGIDDVLACQLSSNNSSIVYAKDMWNPEDQSTGIRNEINDNQYAIKMVDYSYINGRLRCDFTRLIITNNTAQDRHLNEDWYILLAYSDEKGTKDSRLTVYHGHNQRCFSSDRVNVSSVNGSNAQTACPVTILEQVHGICMFVSFGILVPLAIFLAAYMKQPLANHGAWFQVHRALMILAIPVTIAGFVAIFVALQGFPSSFGTSYPMVTSHVVIGFLVVALQFLNPFIGFLRPKPKSTLRPLFYLFHAVVVGYGMELLGAVNICLGLLLFEDLIGISILQNRPFWVWIALLVLYGVVDTLAFVHRLASQKRKVAEDRKALLRVEKKGKGAQKASYIQWTLFTAAVIILAFFGASVITLLTIACSPQEY